MRHKGEPPTRAKTHASAVVLIPPEAVWGPIQAIREAHDRNVKRWMPHVTLMYPFAPPGPEDAALLGYIAAACRLVDPFDVTLAGFRVFRHGRSATVWLDPQPADPITTLQDRLHERLPGFDDVRFFAAGFTPHLSVGQARSADRSAALIAELAASWAPVKFRADKVALIRRNDPPDDVFRVAAAVALGTGDILEGGC